MSNLTVKTEANAMTIGLDNQIVKAFQDKEFGVRLVINNEDHNFRSEYVLSEEGALDLIEQIKSSLTEIQKAKKVEFWKDHINETGFTNHPVSNTK